MPPVRSQPAISGPKQQLIPQQSGVHVRGSALANRSIYFIYLCELADKEAVHASGQMGLGGLPPPVIEATRRDQITASVPPRGGMSNADCHPMDRGRHSHWQPVATTAAQQDTGPAGKCKPTQCVGGRKVSGAQPPERFSLPSSCPM